MITDIHQRAEQALKQESKIRNEKSGNLVEIRSFIIELLEEAETARQGLELTCRKKMQPDESEPIALKAKYHKSIVESVKTLAKALGNVN